MASVVPNLWKLPPPPPRFVKSRSTGSAMRSKGEAIADRARSVAAAWRPMGSSQANTTMTTVRATASCAACALSHSGRSTRSRSQPASERCRWSRATSSSAPMENMRKALGGCPLVVAMMASRPAPAGITASQALRQRKMAQAAV